MSDTSSDNDEVQDAPEKKVASKEWKRRWESDVRWISALLHAADAAGIVSLWKEPSQFGRKGRFREKLEKKMRKMRHVKGEKLPDGRSLQDRVEHIVRAWAAGDKRKNKDGVNDSMWQAMLEQARDDSALQKGDHGYKAWSEIREYLYLTGWVGEDLPEDDERVPDEETKKTVHGYLAILPSLRDALLAQEANTEAEKMGKAKKAKVDAAKEAHGLAAER